MFTGLPIRPGKSDGTRAYTQTYSLGAAPGTKYRVYDSLVYFANISLLKTLQKQHARNERFTEKQKGQGVKLLCLYLREALGVDFSPL